ncbi:unnamed protein product [Mytilus edulis]|uniref:Uncharacterized protein n=1 Tax=Mytilus edulis TaxID=6550 RepID=A0A8S3S1L5_MYTED|nr:unnamed protein product [Mytilus edulis]
MSMQKDFIDKVRSLKTVMNDYGNPFLEDSEDIYKIDSKDIVQAGTGKLSQIKQIGCNQYADFRNRMQNTASIYEPIKKNKFLLFSRQPKKSSCETKSKLDLAREDCSLFSRLFISCQSRQCDLEEFFSHENQKFSPSLSQSGKINIGVKSQLMEILEAKGDLPREEPQTDMVVVDAPFDINEFRLELFARKQRQYDTIPLTRAALLEHTKRATYKGGHVWGQTVTQDQHLPSPGDWGWVKENADGMLIHHWTQLAAIAASCQELHKCGCKKLVLVDVSVTKLA